MTMRSERCPYFSLETRQVYVPARMLLPICRCVLTEVMLQRLAAHPEGKELLPFMEATPLDEKTPRPLIGADLQPISPQTCTVERKDRRCIPGFVELLTDFGLDTQIPLEPGEPRSETS